MSVPLPIDEMWKSYRKDVVPDDAPEAQVIESRRAFVSGACALFWLVMKTSEVSDSEGLAIMDAIHKEIDDFRKEAFTEFLKSRPVGGHA